MITDLGNIKYQKDLMKAVTNKLVAFANVVTLSVALAGCGDLTDDGLDPSEFSSLSIPTTETLSPSTSPSAAWTAEEQAIIAGYEKFWKECVPAAANDPLNAKHHLTPCMTGSFLQDLVAGYADSYTVRGVQEVGRESVVLDPQKPLMDNPSLGFATLHSCHGTSGITSIDVKSGNKRQNWPENKSIGTVLLKKDEIWRVVAISYPENIWEYCK